MALSRVLTNQGARTAGVDGISKKDLRTEEQQAEFVTALQADLKAGTYKPMPVRRQWIPKPGKPEMRGLGIPTTRDRVVQEELRMLLEPIWESDFLDCSHGFRPGRRTMDCVRVFYTHVQRRVKSFWAIEGDIRKCFDRVNHRILLRLIRQRIADQRIVSLIVAFLKAGLMDDGLFQDTPEGTPQGGILSPLLANIYLHQLDLWWWRKFGSLTKKQKEKRRSAGQGNATLVRYADDFVILWNGTHQDVLALRDELRQFLWDKLHLELSEEKTRVTHLQDGIDFLGFHIQWRIPKDGHKPWLRVTPTRENIKRLKAKIRALTRTNTTYATPEMRFKSLNRLIRGWGNYYRHVSFNHDAIKLDYWINRRVLIWLKHKHQGKGVRWILRRYKRREVCRWNWGAAMENGGYIYIAKLGDVPLQPYLRRKRPNPYLEEREVPTASEMETPFREPRVVNVPPEEVCWRERRAEAMRRDGYRCTRCGKPLDEAGVLEVHHQIARRHDGAHSLENLVTLCEECHYQTPTYGCPQRDERSMESRMRRKSHVRFGGEGDGNTAMAT